MASSAYKLKKGETLESVAKSHQLQVDEIWKYGPNIALVRKRRTPDKCEAGDEVELPQSKAERKAAVAKLEAFMGTLREKIAYCDKASKRLAEMKSELATSYKVSIAEIDKLEGRIKLEGDVADIGACFAGSVNSARMFSNSCKEIKLLEETAVKTPEIVKKIDGLDKGLRTSMKEFAVHPLSSPAYASGATVLSDGTKSDNAFFHAVGTAASWFGALTSPSGWAEMMTHAHRDLAKMRAEVESQTKETLAAVVAREARLAKEAKAAKDMIGVLTPALANMKK